MPDELFCMIMYGLLFIFMPMILPIVAYGAKILETPCTPVNIQDTGLQGLIDAMWKSLDRAHGCGLAAPQVNYALRLFLVDSLTTYEMMEAELRPHFFYGDTGIKEVFINPQILYTSDDLLWTDEEGCLSIPGLQAPVERPWHISISYYDQDLLPKTRVFSGLTARMIQHEYDHIEGILYLEHLSPAVKKPLLKKLNAIKKGKFTPKYPMQILP